MTNPRGHDYQHRRKRQFWNDHGRPDRNCDSAGRGDRVTRQSGGWGGSWGEDALEAACVANCRSSNICDEDDTTCLCNATANQRVLRCLQSSCSDDAGEAFESEIDDICGEAGLVAAAAAPAASPSNEPSSSASTTRSPALSANSVVPTGQNRTPLSDIRSSSGTSTSPNSIAAPPAPSSASQTPILQSVTATHRTFLADDVAAGVSNSTSATSSSSTTSNSSSRSSQSALTTPSSSTSSSSQTRQTTPTSRMGPATTWDPTTLPPVGDSQFDDSNGGLSGLAIFGVVSAVLACLALVALLACLLRRRKQGATGRRGSDSSSSGSGKRDVSPPHLVGGNAAHTTSWIDFRMDRDSMNRASGAGAGFTIGNDQEEKEKISPIYAMYASARPRGHDSQSSASTGTGHPSASPGQLAAALASFGSLDASQASGPGPANSRRTSTSRGLSSSAPSRKSTSSRSIKSRMMPRWIDVRHATQQFPTRFSSSDSASASGMGHLSIQSSTGFSQTPSSFVLPTTSRNYRSGGTTSFFSRLLIHDQIPRRSSAGKSGSRHKTRSRTAAATATAAARKHDSKESLMREIDTLSRGASAPRIPIAFPAGQRTDQNPEREDLDADTAKRHSVPVLPYDEGDEIVIQRGHYHTLSDTSFIDPGLQARAASHTAASGRPSMASSRHSLPHDVAGGEADAELDELKAASTRAPSVDLQWVTQCTGEMPTLSVPVRSGTGSSPVSAGATPAPAAGTLSPTHSSATRRVKRKPSLVSLAKHKSASRKSAPSLPLSALSGLSFTPSMLLASSTPSTPRRSASDSPHNVSAGMSASRRASVKPPLPAIPPTPDLANPFTDAGSESPALPSSNNSRPTSTKTLPTPTTASSTRVGRAI